MSVRSLDLVSDHPTTKVREQECQGILGWQCLIYRDVELRYRDVTFISATAVAAEDPPQSIFVCVPIENVQLGPRSGKWLKHF